jgi:sarcosine oxidase
VPADWQAVLAGEAGIVDATKTVLTLAALAQAHGAELAENVRVQRIDPGPRPVLHTSAGRLSCDRLIVAAGGWLPVLCPELALPLTVTLEAAMFYRPADPDAFRPDRFPIFIVRGGNGEPYGFPTFGLPGIKLGFHMIGPETTADGRGFTVPQQALDLGREFLERHLPGAAGPEMLARTCLYTNTPDSDFIIGPHPACPQITLASPCSGHGFKFVPLLGEIVAATALGEGHEFALPRFRTRLAAPAA